MQLHYRIQSTATWLFYEPRHLWLCTFVCLAAIATIVLREVTEPTIRIVGLALQVCGIVTVVWGIIATRQFFGMKSPQKTIVDWLWRCPLFGKSTIGAVGAALSASGVTSTHGYASLSINPSAELEQRVSVLEQSIPMMQDRISGLQVELTHASQSLKDQLKSEQQDRLALAERFDGRLKSYGTGGLHISAIGAVWLLLGAVLSTASAELCVLLR